MGTIDTQRREIVAHRGFHPVGGPSENSLLAFHAAVDAGATVLETDIRRTRDGVLVTHHDPELANGVALADLDYAQLPPLPDGQRIPRLVEVAQVAAQRGVRLAAELKEKGYERRAVDELASVLPVHGFDLISFTTGSIEAVEQYRPEVRTGLLAPRIPEWLRKSFAWPALARMLAPLDLPLRGAARVGADYVSVHWQQARPHLLDSAARSGVDVHVWTVNDPELLARLLRDDRVSGVVTDRTDLAAALSSPALLGAAQLEPAVQHAA